MVSLLSQRFAKEIDVVREPRVAAVGEWFRIKSTSSFVAEDSILDDFLHHFV